MSGASSAQILKPLSHEDRLLTFVEDGSTLEEFIDRALMLERDSAFRAVIDWPSDDGGYTVRGELHSEYGDAAKEIAESIRQGSHGGYVEQRVWRVVQ